MPFDNPNVLVESIDDRLWSLERTLIYHGAEDVFIVPAQYVTDFTSSPRITNWLVPVSGIHSPAAVLHDWLITDRLPIGAVSSIDADGIFRRVLKEMGVPTVKRWIMWAGVRWGALFNSRRRTGWWRTAPRVLLISVLAAPIVVPPALGNLYGMLVYGLAEFVATRGRKAGTLRT